MRMYDSDQQQSEVLQNFWYKHNKKIITLIVTLFLSLWGYQQWTKKQADYYQQASLMYQQLLDFDHDQHTKQAEEIASTLINKYRKTPYADLAGLSLAKHAIQDKNYTNAANIYQQILAHSPNHAIKVVTAVRLAVLYIELGKPQQAIDLIDQQPHQIFPSRFDEVKGDALMAMNRHQAAFDTYQAAIDAMPHTPRWQMALTRITLKQNAVFEQSPSQEVPNT